MIEPIDTSQLPAPAQKLLDGGAPAKLRQMAAKGVVPGLRPDALLTVLVVLATGGDRELAATAQHTLSNLPEPVLRGALDGDLPAAVCHALAERYARHMPVVEKLVRMPRLAIDTVELLAEKGDEAVTELVATNQERILAHPEIIERLYMNRNTRMSTADRLVELAVRHNIELHGIPAWKEIAHAIKGELIAESSPDPLPEDIEFYRHDRLAKELEDEAREDAYRTDEEGEETLDDKLVPLYKRLADMTVSQKIRRAMLGTKEERMMLIREQNKIIARAAAQSPLLKENEVAQITRSRGVVEDVLMIISRNPKFMKSYQVKRNLVENSKTPIMVAQKLVIQLREADLRKVAKSKSISSAVQLAARRHLERRKQ